MKTKNIDHLVLTVHDIPTSCAFYSDILGMEIIDPDFNLIELSNYKQK